jgi:hypothetical protein
MPQYFCIFSDTLIREQPSDDEYFESITFQFPLTLQALKICAQGSPLPGAADAKSNTSPPNFKFEIFAVDLKNEEAVCLVPVGNGSYHSSSSSTDYHLKPIMTNQLLIRGNYTSISMALYGNSSKFKPKEEEKEEKLSSHRSARDERDRDRGSSDNDDDRYDDWAYVKHVRDSHQDKIYPITMDSDLPLSDSDEEQEPRMALPLAAPTLPQAIAAQGNPGEVKSEELDPEVKAEMEKAPPVSNRLSPMEIPSGGIEMYI